MAVRAGLCCARGLPFGVAGDVWVVGVCDGVRRTGRHGGDRRARTHCVGRGREVSVLAVWPVLAAAAVGGGAPVVAVSVLLLLVRHQRALQTGSQNRFLVLRLVRVNGSPQVAHLRVAVRTLFLERPISIPHSGRCGPWRWWPIRRTGSWSRGARRRGPGGSASGRTARRCRRSQRDGRDDR